MATVYGPTVARLRLRHELRLARERAGLTQEQTADSMDWSVSKVMRIEAGTVTVSTTDVRAMLNLFGVTSDHEIDALVELARAARQRTWWTRYRDAIPAPYASYIGLEAEASTLDFYQPLLIPALLQTTAYAEAVLRDASAMDGLSPHEQRTRLDIQLTRQREVLDRASPPTVNVVLDELTLRRGPGRPALLREQLLHLVALGSSAHVRLQVLPVSAGLVTTCGPFVILEFAGDTHPDVVYVESSLSTLVLERQDGVATYRAEFERLRGHALKVADSLTMIASMAGELG